MFDASQFFSGHDGASFLFEDVKNVHKTVEASAPEVIFGDVHRAGDHAQHGKVGALAQSVDQMAG